MSDFEESLRKTLFGIGEAYKATEKDLLEETTSASESIYKVTAGMASLRIKKESESSERVLFTLYLFGDNRLSEITHFVLSAAGYPIRVASSQTMITIESYEAILTSREQIKDYFNSLASNPDSRLVLRIAFIFRQKNVLEPASE